MNKRKNVLVIGGAGFLGSHLCERLLQNHNVICIDNFSSSSEKNISQFLRLANFKFIRLNINEPFDLEKIKDLEIFKVNIFGISEIYNLACPTSVSHFEKMAHETVLANTIGLINALNVAVKYKAKFMQFSSSVVYGETPRDEYIAENYLGRLNPLDNRACYDLGKLYSETIVDTYRQSFKIDTKIVRIFRTFGPRMLLDDGQMVPDFIINALENKDLIIYGKEDFQTTLCYVSDVVEGCLSVMNSPVNEPINIGQPEVYKLVDIAAKIIKATGSKSKIVFKEEKLFMRELALPNITKAKEIVGWFPVITIDDGLNKTINFTRANKDLLTFSKDI